jgi:hypothetical protein
VQLVLAAIGALGLGLRALACFFDPPLHPDEYFQYLEPAYWHLTGVGLEAWEWREGIRSWVLPFYNGAWLALLMRLGVRSGPTLALCLKLHWALLAASVIPLAYRGASLVSRRLQPVSAAPDAAAAGCEGGLIAAALCAGFPLLVVYSAHTLSEVPSMLCLLAGLVLCAELLEAAEAPALDLRRGALAGALLSLGACLRIANAPLVLVPIAWLLVRRRYHALSALLAAALVPALLFALVDLITWGHFAGSFLGYLKFNLVEGKAARFGTEPAWWYLNRLWSSAPLALPLLLGCALWGVRGSWPFVLSALGMVAYLSSQPHKESRFVLAFWPLISIAAAGTLGAWSARAREQAASRFARLRVALPAALVLLVLLDAARDFRQDYWLEPGRSQCQVWAGAQRDVTGLLVDDPVFATGSLGMTRPTPQFDFERGLLSNPLLNYAVVGEDSGARRAAERAGFEIVHRAGGFVALRRRIVP